MSFDEMTGLNIALIGATGGIGHALVKQLSKDNDVQTFSRRGADDIHINITDEDTIKDAARHVSMPLDLVIVATGLLHNNEHLQPEKSIKDLNYEDLISAFAINTIGPSLVAKHFMPLLKREQRSTFAALSARVGSISDNHLGGWYGYRAAKAALNMMLRNLSIEAKRTNKQSIIIGLHPGTVDTKLSKPFQSHVAEGKLFTADHAAQCLINVIKNRTPEDSGFIFDWDNKKIEY